MKDFGKTRYYAIRVGDSVEIRATKKGIRRVTSTLKRSNQHVLKQVYYDGGKVLTIRPYEEIKTTFTMKKDEAKEVTEGSWRV